MGTTAGRVARVSDGPARSLSGELDIIDTLNQAGLTDRGLQANVALAVTEATAKRQCGMPIRRSARRARRGQRHVRHRHPHRHRQDAGSGTDTSMSTEGLVKD